MERSISQSQYLFYDQCDTIYRGYVKGIGESNPSFKEYMMAPNPQDTMRSGSPMFGCKDSLIQSIGYVPAIDTSPSKVIRSYGNEAAQKINEKIIQSRGDSVAIYLGDTVEPLYLTKDNQYAINSCIKNEFKDNAEYELSIKYVDDKGSHSLTNTYPLDSLNVAFSKVNWQDLYTCQPESISMNQALESAVILNSNLKNNIKQIPNIAQETPSVPQFSHPISEPPSIPQFNPKQEVPRYQPVLRDEDKLDKFLSYTSLVDGASGFLGSYSEFKLDRSIERDFRNRRNIIRNQETIIRDRRPIIESNYQETRRTVIKSNIKNSGIYHNPNGEIIPALKKKYDIAVNSAYKKPTLLEEIKNYGKVWESRRLAEFRNSVNKRYGTIIASKIKYLRCLRTLNPVLNAIGLGVSTVSLFKHGYDLYTGKQKVNWRTVGKTLKLTADVAFSAVAIWGGPAGWIAAGTWFVVSTAVDFIWDAVEN